MSSFLFFSFLGVNSDSFLIGGRSHPSPKGDRCLTPYWPCWSLGVSCAIGGLFEDGTTVLPPPPHEQVLLPPCSIIVTVLISGKSISSWCRHHQLTNTQSPPLCALLYNIHVPYDGHDAEESNDPQGAGSQEVPPLTPAPARHRHRRKRD